MVDEEDEEDEEERESLLANMTATEAKNRKINVGDGDDVVDIEIPDTAHQISSGLFFSVPIVVLFFNLVSIRMCLLRCVEKSFVFFKCTEIVSPISISLMLFLIKI